MLLEVLQAKDIWFSESIHPDGFREQSPIRAHLKLPGH
jgi:hypothetical protein